MWDRGIRGTKGLRIAFLTPEYVRGGYPDGGLANYLAKLCPLLQESGHDPVVFLLGHKEDDQYINGVRVIEVRASWARKWGGRRYTGSIGRVWRIRHNSQKLAQRFRREHRLNSFDIVQAASYLSVGLALVKRSPAPVVTRVSSYTPLLRSCKGIRRTRVQTLIEWWEIRQMQLSDAVFCPSVFLARTLERFEAIQANVIPSAFGLPETQYDESVFREKLRGRRYLLFFGTLSRLKGIDVLGEALPSVLRAHSDLHVVFVGRDDGMGRGQGTCREFLHNQLKEVAGRVCMLDRLPRDQLLPIIEHAAFVVLPSRVDNLPNTCLEAQSLGRIVIGTRDSSIDELVDDGSTGFLAENGSITSLQAAIYRALAMNTEEKHEMEVRTRAMASQRSGVHSTDELVSYYENVVRNWKQ